MILIILKSVFSLPKCLFLSMELRGSFYKLGPYLMHGPGPPPAQGISQVL